MTTAETIYPHAPGFQARATSARAAQAEERNAGLLREQCLMLCQQHDLTADECADMLRKSVLSIRPRFSELAKQGEILDSGKRRKNSSGHTPIVWSTKRQPDLF